MRWRTLYPNMAVQTEHGTFKADGYYIEIIDDEKAKNFAAYLAIHPEITAHIKSETAEVPPVASAINSATIVGGTVDLGTVLAVDFGDSTVKNDAAKLADVTSTLSKPAAKRAFKVLRS